MDKKEVIGFLNEKWKELFELGGLPPDNIKFPRWCQTIEGVLFKFYGKDSWEYQTFKEAGVLRGIVEDKHTQYHKALKERENALVSIINTHEAFGEEEPLALKDTDILPLQLFDAMHLHPKVVEASRKLFKDGHYRDAIYRAFVEVNNFVKDKSNIQLDGRKLMSTVFSLDKPIIKLNSLKTQSDKDEQEGFMLLFMGAMEGIRNPKAHENIIQNNPYRTLEYLCLASLLMKIAAEGELVKAD